MTNFSIKTTKHYTNVNFYFHYNRKSSIFSVHSVELGTIQCVEVCYTKSRNTYVENAIKTGTATRHQVNVQRSAGWSLAGGIFTDSASEALTQALWQICGHSVIASAGGGTASTSLPGVCRTSSQWFWSNSTPRPSNHVNPLISFSRPKYVLTKHIVRLIYLSTTYAASLKKTGLLWLILHIFTNLQHLPIISGGDRPYSILNLLW